MERLFNEREYKKDIQDLKHCYLLEKPLLNYLGVCNDDVVKAEICSLIDELCELKHYNIIEFINCISCCIKDVKGVR